MNKTSKIFLVILLFLSLSIGGFIAGYLLGNKVGDKKGGLKLQTKKPIITNVTKTQKINKDGGKLLIVDNSGTKTTLIIPPNSLGKETEITLSALQEIPVEGLRPAAVLPGVMISPDNLVFRLPATLVFDFNPNNDQIEIPEINLPTVSEVNPNLAINLPENSQITLSPEEQQRRQQAPQRQFGQSAGVIYTNGSNTQPGSAIFASVSNANAANGTIQTQVDNSGTYSPIPEVEQAEAKAIIERVLNDPNATPEQILEAAGLAQAWGFDDLEQKSLAKLKETMKNKVKEISDSCNNPEGTPMSKAKILKIQAVVQALGFTAENLTLTGLLNTCKRKYTMEYSYHDWERTDTYKAEVCGFIDDLWTMNVGLAWDCGGSGAVDPFSFSLPSFGGLTTVIFPWSGSGCACGNCSSLTNSSVSLLLNYDGNKTVIFSQAGAEERNAHIQQQGSCQN